MSQTKNKGWIKALSGISREGREIEFYIAFNDTPGPINTLILGAFHGDERESELLTSRFLASVSLEEWDAEHRVAVVPVVNPDGFHVNAADVDLNRNFPTKDWAELNPDTPYYSGKSAASEPETQFILKLLAQFPPQKIISIHTPYKVINFDGPAQSLAEAMSALNGYPVVDDIGYGTQGSFGTYTGKERQIPTITLELPETDFDESAIEQNLQALKAAIAWK
jgi:murein peptide amidase A